MKPHSNMKFSIEEIHHTQKKDAPSGTAITLAEEIIEASDKKNKWVNNDTKMKMSFQSSVKELMKFRVLIRKIFFFSG